MNDLQILNGDSLKVLPKLAAESVQSCVTSPPYWGLRDYDHPAQIGAESSPEIYVENLVKIFREVRRVLRKDGTVWLNVGDGYARNGGVGKPDQMRRSVIRKSGFKNEIAEFLMFGIKRQRLFGMPWRVAFALQEDGWILRSKITWVKKNPMPESVKNRPTSATEEIFLFSKSPKYFYDPDGVREESGANLRNYWILGPDSQRTDIRRHFP